MKLGDRVGKYLITDKLGEGGMGVVFGAQHEALGRDVAIKVLHAQYAQRSDLMERFWREAEAVSAIGHPNIVAVYDFAKLADGSLYYVMERVRGETMRARLRREPPMGRDELAAIFVQICRALQATHQRGITHRDLKPDNILLQTQTVGPPHIKLLDYGIAKVRENERDPSLTGTGAILGTPQYMAPEQVAAAQLVDGRADLYSLGALLYEVYTGKPPFTGDPLKVMMAQMKDPVVPVKERATREISDAMAALIMRSLEKDPDARPKDALEFSVLLEKALGLTPSSLPIGNEPAPATPPSRAPSPLADAAAPRPRWYLGRWLLTAVIAVVLATIIGVVHHVRHRDTVDGSKADTVLEQALAADGPQRLMLAELLIDADKPPADLVKRLCNDANPEVRRAAAWAAVQTNDPELDAILAESEERSGGQVAIDIALARAIRDPKLPLGSLETLGNQLDPTSFLRLTRAKVLRKTVPADGLYRAVLAAVRAPVTERAVALQMYGDRDAIVALGTDRNNPPELRLAAALALVKPVDAEPILHALDGNVAPVLQVRSWAARMSRIPESRRQLEEAMRDGKHPDAQALASLWATRVGPTALPVLQKNLRDGELRVQLASAVALRILSATESPKP